MTFYVGSEYLNSDPTLGQPAVQEFKLSISTAADWSSSEFSYVL